MAILASTHTHHTCTHTTHAHISVHTAYKCSVFRCDMVLQVRYQQKCGRGDEDKPSSSIGHDAVRVKRKLQVKRESPLQQTSLSLPCMHTPINTCAYTQVDVCNCIIKKFHPLYGQSNFQCIEVVVEDLGI